MPKETQDAAESVRVEIRPGALDKRTAAAYMAISERGLERLVAARLVLPRRIGVRRMVFLPADLDAYLASLPVAR